MQIWQKYTWYLVRAAILEPAIILEHDLAVFSENYRVGGRGGHLIINKFCNLEITWWSSIIIKKLSDKTFSDESLLHMEPQISVPAGSNCNAHKYTTYK